MLDKYAFVRYDEKGCNVVTLLGCTVDLEVFAKPFDWQTTETSWERLVGRARFILSKGHAAPIFYTVLAHAGYFDRDELCGLRRVNCRAEGHPVQDRLPGIETTSGSLGKGISVGLGHVLRGRLNGTDYRVYVLFGGRCSWRSVSKSCGPLQRARS